MEKKYRKKLMKKWKSNNKKCREISIKNYVMKEGIWLSNEALRRCFVDRLVEYEDVAVPD